MSAHLQMYEFLLVAGLTIQQMKCSLMVTWLVSIQILWTAPHKDLQQIHFVDQRIRGYFRNEMRYINLHFTYLLTNDQRLTFQDQSSNTKQSITGGSWNKYKNTITDVPLKGTFVLFTSWSLWSMNENSLWLGLGEGHSKWRILPFRHPHLLP